MNPEGLDFENLDIDKIRAICPVLGAMSVEAAQGMVDNLTPEDIAMLYQTYMPAEAESENEQTQEAKSTSVVKEEASEEIFETKTIDSVIPDVEVVHEIETFTQHIPEQIVPMSTEPQQTIRTQASLETVEDINDDVAIVELMNEQIKTAPSSQAAELAPVALDFEPKVIKPASVETTLIPAADSLQIPESPKPKAIIPERQDTLIIKPVERAEIVTPVAIAEPISPSETTVDKSLVEIIDKVKLADELDEFNREDFKYFDLADDSDETIDLEINPIDAPIIFQSETNIPNNDLEQIPVGQFAEELEQLFLEFELQYMQELTMNDIVEEEEIAVDSNLETIEPIVMLDTIIFDIEQMFDSGSVVEIHIPVELTTAIYNIKQAVEAQIAGDESEIELTPEIIEDLIVILTTVGYKEPRTILKNYAKSHTKQAFITLLTELLPDYAKIPEFQQYLIRLQNSQKFKSKCTTIVGYLLRLVQSQAHTIASQAA